MSLWEIDSSGSGEQVIPMFLGRKKVLAALLVKFKIIVLNKNVTVTQTSDEFPEGVVSLGIELTGVECLLTEAVVHLADWST